MWRALWEICSSSFVMSCECSLLCVCSVVTWRCSYVRTSSWLIARHKDVQWNTICFSCAVFSLFVSAAMWHVVRPSLLMWSLRRQILNLWVVSFLMVDGHSSRRWNVKTNASFCIVILALRNSGVSLLTWFGLAVLICVQRMPWRVYEWFTVGSEYWVWFIECSMETQDFKRSQRLGKIWLSEHLKIVVIRFFLEYGLKIQQATKSYRKI